MRYNKTLIILLLILFIGGFLRFYKLNDLMPFIADQGWYYMQARDMILNREIPLVGIESSHPWLHQGALWSYILGVILLFTNFNPVSGAYLTAALGVFSIALIYYLGRKLFDEKLGLITAFLYATSPALIMDDRMSYHTTPIPFFTILLILFVFKWVKGDIRIFPIIIFLLGILYNFEIATFTLIGTVFLIFLFGLVKKKDWVMSLWNKKTIIYSGIGFLIPMLPMLLYDLTHGFPQTIKLVVWVFYRVAVFLGYPPLNPNAPGETWQTFFTFALELVRKTYFYKEASIAVLILVISFIFIAWKTYQVYKEKKDLTPFVLVFIFFLVPFMGYIAAKTNSAAYLLMFYPQAMLMVGLLFYYALKNKILFHASLATLLFIGFSNAYFLFKDNYFMGLTYEQRVKAAKEIIKESNGQPYNLLGKGQGSQFKSFVTPHKYLLWWLGSPASEKDEKLKFYVSEYSDRIEIEKVQE